MKFNGPNERRYSHPVPVQPTAGTLANTWRQWRDSYRLLAGAVLIRWGTIAPDDGTTGAIAFRFAVARGALE